MTLLVKGFILLTTFCLVSSNLENQSNKLNPEQFHNELILHRNRRSLADLIEQSINRTISDLINAANQLNTVINNISNTVHNTVTQVLENVNSTASLWINQIEKAVVDTIGNVNTVGAITTECIRNNEEVANGIVNNTVISVTNCVSNEAESVAQMLNNGSQLATTAIQTANTMSNKVVDCLTYNNTFLQLGPCLTSVAIEITPAAIDILGRISAQTALGLLNIISIPIRIPVCMTANVENAGIQIGLLIAAIPQCVAEQTP